MPGFQPKPGKSTRKVPQCPYCNKPFETSYKYHFKNACPVIIQSRMEIINLQKFALANSKQWVHYPCIECGNPINIHIEWKDPQVVCKECIETKPKSKKKNPQKHNNLQSAQKLPSKKPQKKKPPKGFKLGDLIPDKIKKQLNVEQESKE